MSSAKKKHSQLFKDSYTKTWPLLKKSHISPHHAYCTACDDDFIISHGGASDCRKHCKTYKHIVKAKAKGNNKTLDEMIQPESDMNTIKAEAYFTKFLIEHNCPLAVADHAGPLFKKMFPDSVIAKNYSCARTKTTAIVKSLSIVTQEKLVEKLRERKFSLSTDGSNSSEEKLFPLVVTYYDNEIRRIVASLLSLPHLEGDSTGENIFHLLRKEFEEKEISWGNCISFCADNAYVMMGQFKGVSSFIKTMNPNIIIHGCVCHLIHLAAQHAAEKLDAYDIEQFLIDIYFYLKKSSKRHQILKFCQSVCGLEQHKIIKYGTTRWLSLGNVVDRFLEQWDALAKFFCEEEKGSSNTFIKIKELFETRTTKLYLLFLQSTITIFNKTLLLMQSDAPMIHIYHREITSLLTELLARYVKPAVFVKAESVYGINFSKKKNQKLDDELIIGSKTRQYLNNSEISVAAKEKFYECVRSYYHTACTYILKKFPLQEKLYEYASVADVKIKEKVDISFLNFFCDLFGYTDDIKDSIESEFVMYQVDTFSEEITSSSRADEAWALIKQLKDYNGCLKYKHLPDLMLSILLIPHSNAPCERIFSTVKQNVTDYRSNLGHETLEALLIEKCVAKEHGNICYQTVFSNEELQKAKKATYLSLRK